MRAEVSCGLRGVKSFLRWACVVCALWGGVGVYPALADFPCSDSAWAMRDSVGDGNVRSVSIAPVGWGMAPPIVSFAGGRLRLTFDYTGPAPGWFRYRFVRCEKDWRRSDLLPMEYISGFDVNFVPGYSPSLTSTTDYMHYEIVFPNRDVRFKLSGNYVVQIVDPYDDSVILLQRQFALCEDVLAGKIALGSCTDENFVESTALEVRLSGRPLARAPEQLTVYSKQNWNDPRSQELRYERTADWEGWTYGSLFSLRRNGVWNNGAAWRMLDLRSFDVPGVGVERVRKVGWEMHVEVQVGEANDRWNPPKGNGLKGYFLYGERWGNEEREDAEETADYAYVYFSLKPSSQSSLFVEPGVPLLMVPGVEGAQKGVEMRYNASREQYEATLYMKQGVYSYRYAWKTAKGIDYTAFEGSYAGTPNEYHVLCYFRGDADRTDRLVAHLVSGNERISSLAASLGVGGVAGRR